MASRAGEQETRKLESKNRNETMAGRILETHFALVFFNLALI
jgi:hypothetical protein